MTTPTDIDDSDSTVSYTGDWITSGISSEYLGTIHGTHSLGAKAVLRFRGTSIDVYGTIAGVEFSGDSGAANSSYTLDNSAAPTFFYALPVSKGPAYNQHFYHSGSLDPNVEHTLVVTLVATGRSGLWLDRFAVAALNGETPTSLVPPSPGVTQKQDTGAGEATVTSTASESHEVAPGTTLSTGSQSSIFTTFVLSVSAETSKSYSSMSQPTAQPSIANSTTTSTSHGLSKGATIGIVVGAVSAIILLGIIGVLFFYLIRRRKTGRIGALESTPSSEGVSSDMGSGYVVRGGLSGEKLLPNSNVDHRGREEVNIAEPPPLYQENMPLAASSSTGFMLDRATRQ
ncbi:hypothetical protein H0H87_008660 [Tephrocybe sp. NHM501043]|nr:hypothetical protein H0H87_008660 [Tephrocybe sp. NHM501043]